MNKGLKAVLAAVMLGSGLLAWFPAPAAAEFDSTKYSTYGVATQGNSDTIAGWDALTWEYGQVGNTVFVGGNYLDIVDGANNVVGSQPYLAAFEADTGKWESWWRPQVGSAVFAMENSPDGGLFVGGEMGTWNGETLGALVKIDPATGELWPGFTTRVYGGSSVVRDLQLENDGKLYIVGNFNTVSHEGVIDNTKSGAVRIDPLTGAIDTDWDPIVTNGSVWGVSRSHTLDRVYLAGHFDYVNGELGTAGFVGVDDLGEVVNKRDFVPFNGCYYAGNPSNTQGYCAQMYDVVATPSGDVWVGGVEHALYVLTEGPDPANTAGQYTPPPTNMRWHHYTGCDPNRPENQPCSPNPAGWYGGEFQEIELIGDRIYATCHCWYDMYSSTTQVLKHASKFAWTGTEGVDYFHTTINAVAAFDAVTGEAITTFAPLLGGDAGGFGVHQNPSDGCLWVAGGIDSYGPPGGVQPLAHDVVRLCDSTGPGPAATPDGVPPAVEVCSVALDGVDATITWTVPQWADRVIVERSVDGGNWFWRAGIDSPGSSFNEQIPAGSNTLYRVRAKYQAGQLSAYLLCDGPPFDADLTVLTTPCPIYDSTTASGSLAGPLGANSTRTIQVVGGLPANQGVGVAECVPFGASSVVFTVSALDSTGPGNLRLSPAGIAADGGVVNYTANGLNNTNTVTVPLSAAGEVDVFANASPAGVRLVALGYYSAGGSLKYNPLTPCAVSDSRASQGPTEGFIGPFVPGSDIPDIDVVGTFSAGQGSNGVTDCGVPAGASAVVLNVVAVSPTGGQGYIAAATGGLDPTEPVTAFADIQLNNAASVVVPLAGETVSLDVGAVSGSPSTHVRVVVLGYLTTTGDSYRPLSACAAFDSRPGLGATDSFLGSRVADTATTYQVTGVIPTAQGGAGGDCGVPSGATAVLINLVGIQPSAVGNFRAYATGSIPTGGVLNFAPVVPAMNNSNAVVVPLDAAGRLDVFINAPGNTGNPTVHARGVILGYYT